MAPSMDKLIDGMIHPTLTVITGAPCYETIKEVNAQLMCDNAYTNTNLGCGTVGYACITLNSHTYNNISIVA